MDKQFTYGVFDQNGFRLKTFQNDIEEDFLTDLNKKFKFEVF